MKAGERLERAVARLDVLIDWERRERGSMRVSIEPERALLAELGVPAPAFRTVHVTGSKGKGSTSALVAAGLAKAGLRVGRYASPHVERIHERIVLDGLQVGDELLAEGLERSLEARERIASTSEPTWFDVVTAAALWIFWRAQVEWVVAEVGLGGRLDSTNVLEGEVCIVTNIELEHTAVLGATRAAIAAEKAGILKPGCTVVTALAPEDEAGRIVARRAAELGAKVLRPSWAGADRALTIEQRNASLAGLALDELGRRGVRDRDGQPVSAGLLDAETLRSARLPGRLERFVVAQTPVVLDGAHTPESVRAVVADLQADPSLPGKPVVVLGLARDKDAGEVLKALAPAAERLFCTSVGTALHRTPEELAHRAHDLGIAADSSAPPLAALDRAIAAARGRWVLVIGSLYLAGALRPHLRQVAP